MKAYCAHCDKEYERPVYVGDKENIYLQLFCSKECDKNWDIILESQDWPRDPALKYKIPVGYIACPHCGTVYCGIIETPTCGFCDKGYWEEVEDELQRT